MRKITAGLALWTALAAIAGCAKEWSRPGTTAQELNADKLTCEQEAMKQYPVTHDPPVAYRPPAPNKLDPNCVQQSGFDNCGSALHGGPPSDPQRDANAYNRDASIKACLTAKGYTYQRVSR